MRISSRAEIPIPRDDAYAAIQQVSSLLRSAVQPTADASFELRMHTDRHPEAIRQLAAILPPEFPGFHLLDPHVDMTAGEFLERVSAKSSGRVVGYAEERPENLGFDHILMLFEALVTLGATPLRQTTISLLAKGIRWNGSPAGSDGQFYLLYRHDSGRKSRFASATVRLNGESSEDRVFRKALRGVAEATGLPFDKGRFDWSYDPGERDAMEPEVADPPPVEQAIVLFACYRLACERTREELARRRIEWQDLPGLTTRRGAVLKRIKAQQSGQIGRVDFDRALTRFLTSEFPGFVYDKESKYGRSEIFRRTLSENWSLRLEIDKPMSRLGKTFTVGVGIEGRQGSLVRLDWGQDLFDFLRGPDQVSEPHWVYVTNDDLVLALNGFGSLLREALPVIEDAFRRELEPPPLTLPPHLRHRGPLTAREAYSEALGEARRWQNDARLTSIVSAWAADASSFHTISLLYRTELRTQLDDGGRIKTHSAWRYRFDSPSTNSSMWILVPCLGPVVRSVIPAPTPPHEDLLPPIGDDWIDSGDALRILDQNASSAAPPGAEGLYLGGLQLRFDSALGHSRWQATYHFMVEEFRSGSMTVSLLAADGSDIRVECRVQNPTGEYLRDEN